MRQINVKTGSEYAETQAAIEAIPGVHRVTQVFPAETDAELRQMFVVEVFSEKATWVAEFLSLLPFVEEAELVLPRASR